MIRRIRFFGSLGFFSLCGYKRKKSAIIVSKEERPGERAGEPRGDTAGDTVFTAVSRKGVLRRVNADSGVSSGRTC